MSIENENNDSVQKTTEAAEAATQAGIAYRNLLEKEKADQKKNKKLIKGIIIFSVIIAIIVFMKWLGFN